MGQPVTRAWWRRNAVALAVLLVVVPAGLVALDTLEFGTVRNAERSVAAGASTSIADWDFGPVTIEPVDAAEVGAPSGTEPVVVTIRVDRGHRFLGCQAPRIVEPATGRSWMSVTALDWAPPVGAQTTCTSRTGIPYDLVALVLLPNGVGDDLVVELSTGSTAAGGLDLRFAVDR